MIGFVYSVFQFAALVGLMRKDKHLISHPKRDLFDFAMDQVCAPLVLLLLLFLGFFRIVQLPYVLYVMLIKEEE